MLFKNVESLTVRDNSRPRMTTRKATMKNLRSL